MELQLTNDLLKSLLKIVVNAQRQAAIAQRLVALVPALPLDEVQAVRAELNQAYDLLIQSIEDRPSDVVLELLRNCSGTVQ
jgi:uncharacterized protein YecT (DUF1311 family)